MTSSIMLMCAVLASLALGVLIAYGVCISMFNLFQMHARQVAAGNSLRRRVESAEVAKG